MWGGVWMFCATWDAIQRHNKKRWEHFLHSGLRKGVACLAGHLEENKDICWTQLCPDLIVSYKLIPSSMPILLSVSSITF